MKWLTCKCLYILSQCYTIEMMLSLNYKQGLTDTNTGVYSYMIYVNKGKVIQK